MAVRIQMRRDTTANWTSNNPILLGGEIGWDTTSKTGKVGDGVTDWVTLPYSISPLGLIATLAGVEVLTNKTMSGSDNTFSDIPVAAISGLDSALTSYALKDVVINPQTASYTLVLLDNGKLIEQLVASANTLTVPPNSTTPIPIGATIIVLQTGAGQTTLTPGAAVTINGTPGLKLRAQWSSATLIKRATDSWIAMGDLVV
jgi:hypothetical protein